MQRIETYKDLVPYCVSAVSNPYNAVLIKLEQGTLHFRSDYSNCGCAEIHTPMWHGVDGNEQLLLYVVTNGFGHGFPYPQFITSDVPQEYRDANPNARTRVDAVNTWSESGPASSYRNMLRLTYPAGCAHTTEYFVNAIEELLGSEYVQRSDLIYNCNSGNQIQCAIVCVDQERLRRDREVWDRVLERLAKYNLVPMNEFTDDRRLHIKVGE